MFENVKSNDTIILRKIREGKEIDLRITQPKSGIKKYLVSLLKAIGLGKRWSYDLVTNWTKADIANYLTTVFTHIAIGTDDGTILPLDSSNTSLGNEYARQASTNSVVTTTVTNDTAQFEATFNFTESVGIQESGLFDSATGGNMGTRQTFSVMNFSNGDSLVATWKIQVS